MAPGLRRALAATGAPAPSGVTLPRGAASVRGIAAAPSLQTVGVSSHTRLDPLVGLPDLKTLTIDGRFQRRRRHQRLPRWRERVRLQPLARAPALEHLTLHAIEDIVDGGWVLSQIPTLETLEICSGRCPDLTGIGGADLERLDLDGAWGVRPRQLAGLRAPLLDLWGCSLDDIAVLSTMPRLREVWLHGNHVPSLRPLLHLEAGAKVFLDGEVDPDKHRDTIAALEARGVWLLICAEPERNGFTPSWWQSSFAADAPPGGIRYQSLAAG